MIGPIQLVRFPAPCRRAGPAMCGKAVLEGPEFQGRPAPPNREFRIVLCRAAATAAARAAGPKIEGPVRNWRSGRPMAERGREPPGASGESPGAFVMGFAVSTQSAAPNRTRPRVTAPGRPELLRATDSNFIFRRLFRIDGQSGALARTVPSIPAIAGALRQNYDRPRCFCLVKAGEETGRCGFAGGPENEMG